MIILKNKKFAIIVISLLLVITAVFSYAFFGIRESNIADTGGGIEGVITEKLIFENGDGVNLSATLENFTDGSGSLKDETISTATLIPSTEQGFASAKYNVYYDIKLNDFEYSVDNSRAELLLNVVGPDGNAVRTLNGYNYRTVVDAHTGETLSGYDITEVTGLLKLRENFLIESDSVNSVTDEWKVSVVFVNLDVPQNVNFNKSFEAELILQRNKIDSGDIYNPVSETILTNNGGVDSITAKGTPNLLSNATTDEGMFATNDAYGTTYYFRGAVENNWVYFGGYYWRIIRVNGDGSVRLIYTGERSPNDDEKVYLTGSDTILGAVYIDFWGYKKAVSDPASDANMHSNEVDSDAKLFLDEWYSGTGNFSDINYKLIDYSDYIADNVFCGDRTWAVKDHSTSWTFEKSLLDRKETGAFSYICPNQLDSYSVSDGNKGNSVLDYPIATLSGDELGFAGAVYASANSSMYLSSDVSYITMSPMLRSSYSNYYFFFGYRGGSEMRFDSITVYNVSTSSLMYNGVRPVINIKGDTLFTGTGTWDDPYRM